MHEWASSCLLPYQQLLTSRADRGIKQRPLIPTRFALFGRDTHLNFPRTRRPFTVGGSEANMVDAPITCEQPFVAYLGTLRLYANAIRAGLPGWVCDGLVLEDGVD